MTRRPAAVLAISLAVGATLAGGLAEAVSKPPVRSVKACAKSGALKLPANGKCPKGTSTVNLSTTGPTGPAGPKGDPGQPGAAGSTAAAGVQAYDAAGHQVGKLVGYPRLELLVDGHLWLVNREGGTFAPTSTTNVYFSGPSCTGAVYAYDYGDGRQATEQGVGTTVYAAAGAYVPTTVGSATSNGSCSNSSGTLNLAPAVPVSIPAAVPAPVTLR